MPPWAHSPSIQLRFFKFPVFLIERYKAQFQSRADIVKRHLMSVVVFFFFFLPILVFSYIKKKQNKASLVHGQSSVLMRWPQGNNKAQILEGFTEAQPGFCDARWEATFRFSFCLVQNPLRGCILAPDFHPACDIPSMLLAWGQILDCGFLGRLRPL